MKIKPFRGLRPQAQYVQQVASRPYDVLSSAEAKAEAAGKPHSFLNVVKPEISLPDETDQYAQAVYHSGLKNFNQLLDDGVFTQDDKDCLYIYELTMDGRRQDGIVACASVQDYVEGRIKKHELTRADKENDRKNHIRISMLNAEPVFFAYQAVASIDEKVAATKAQHEPVYDFVADDGVQHRFWLLDDEDGISSIVESFAKMDATYVADGHHRTAAAALVGAELGSENPQHNGTEEYNYFLAVHFPDTQLQIIDYNRVVKDLNGLSKTDFVNKLETGFDVENKGRQACKPQTIHEIGMYLDGEWYQLNAKPGTWDETDPIAVLDVTILSEQILQPLLDIHDLRRDKRIDFVGGIRGLEELERRVDNGEMQLAFAMYPVSMQQLMNIADNGLIMPPKVTWFEPKLRSGLVVHSLQD